VLGRAVKGQESEAKYDNQPEQKYASEEYARFDIARIKKKSNRDIVPFRVYFCHCGSWHLTSKLDKREAEINELKIKNIELQKELNETKNDFQKRLDEITKNQNIEDKIVKKVREIEDRKSILVAVPTIEQATKLAGRIPMAAVVTGETPTQDRNRIIEEFRNQKFVKDWIESDTILGWNIKEILWPQLRLRCMSSRRKNAKLSLRRP
jgi:superfamily II DNA or RNA helicase